MLRAGLVVGPFGGAIARVLLGSVGETTLMHDSSCASWSCRAQPHNVPGPAGSPERLRPAPGVGVRQAAVGLIVTVSLVASLGSGIVTSTTPSCVLALMFLASIPGGSAIERLKDP